MVIFDDIDISIMIEREIDDKKVPLPYVTRKTNSKSLRDIAREIEAGKKQAIKDEGDHVLGGGKPGLLMRIYYILPGFLRKLVWKLILRSPAKVKENMGTVTVLVDHDVIDGAPAFRALAYLKELVETGNGI